MGSGGDTGGTLPSDDGEDGRSTAGRLLARSVELVENEKKEPNCKQCNWARVWWDGRKGKALSSREKRLPYEFTFPPEGARPTIHKTTHKLSIYCYLGLIDPQVRAALSMLLNKTPYV